MGAECQVQSRAAPPALRPSFMKMRDVPDLQFLYMKSREVKPFQILLIDGPEKPIKIQLPDPVPEPPIQDIPTRTIAVGEHKVIYAGGLKGRSFNGIGSYCDEEGTFKYTGMFMNCQAHGYGVYLDLRHGTQYKGSFVKNVFVEGTIRSNHFHINPDGSVSQVDEADVDEVPYLKQSHPQQIEVPSME